jgi:hydrogenase maturation protease
MGRCSTSACGVDVVTVIGYGNTLRGDDGVGPAVAEHVATADDRVRSLAVPMLMPELAPLLADAPLIVFVDARMGGVPGQVRIQSLDDGGGDVGAMGHLLSARALVGLSRQLYGCRARAVLVSVDGVCFDLGAPMSPPVEGAIPLTADLVLGFIETAASLRPGRIETRATPASRRPSSPRL